MERAVLEMIANRILKIKFITPEGHWKTPLASLNGHTRIKFHDKGYYIHRILLAYYNDLDYDDDRWMACHKNECGDGDCCCPDHIYKGTARTNIGDAIRKGTHNSLENKFQKAGAAANRAKTHCPQGHPYEGKNLKVDSGGRRHCIMCERKASRDYMRRRRSKINV